MFKREITFDRFVRGLLLLLGVVLTGILIKYLSPVLIPFFVAWLIAYMLYPILHFIETKCRIRSRLVSILLTFLLLIGTISLIAWAVLPPFIHECANLKEILLRHIQLKQEMNQSLPAVVQKFLSNKFEDAQLYDILRQKDIQRVIKEFAPKAWDFLWSTAGIVINTLASLIALLYLFFLLKDYEKYSNAWVCLVPKSKRELAKQIVNDIAMGMNGYFRGQLLVALSNCIMFSIGFWIIGFPIPLGLGCLIGIISFVPYLQVLGFAPAVILALLHSADTGENFWLLMGGVCIVYLVVQIIQDVIVTPRVMGKIMGLSPAVILLSLSVWGYMLGIIGLILALPVTTLLISYYKRYIIENNPTNQESFTNTCESITKKE